MYSINIPQTDCFKHWHGAEAGVADGHQGDHVLRVKRLQGLEVFEGVRVECREPEKSWNFYMT